MHYTEGIFSEDLQESNSLNTQTGIIKLRHKAIHGVIPHGFFFSGKHKLCKFNFLWRFIFKNPAITIYSKYVKLCNVQSSGEKSSLMKFHWFYQQLKILEVQYLTSASIFLWYVWSLYTVCSLSVFSWRKFASFPRNTMSSTFSTAGRRILQHS